MYDDETEYALETHCKEMQRMINSGAAWLMNGGYGRAAMEAMRSGHCILGPKPRPDYWGSMVPSRDAVAPGMTGSPSLVEDTMGPEWLKMLLEVE